MFRASSRAGGAERVRHGKFRSKNRCVTDYCNSCFCETESLIFCFLYTERVPHVPSRNFARRRGGRGGCRSPTDRRPRGNPGQRPSRRQMAPQPIEKIESGPGNGRVSEASKPQHLVHGRAVDRALRPRAARMPKLKVTKLQKKAPNALTSLDAELKSAPAFGSMAKTSGSPGPGVLVVTRRSESSGRAGWRRSRRQKAERKFSCP
jgi:hypothetical protein